MQNHIKETVISNENTTDTQTQTVANSIYFIMGLIEVILLFRFILKVTGANPSSGFVAGIYSLSQILILPFRGIFSSAITPGVEVKAFFEPATLIAMIVYAVLAWGLVRMIAIMAGRSTEEL